MQAFEYVSPNKKEQVAALLGEQGAILAGGTDLLALMKDDVVTPKRLVNIKHIDGLRGISYQPGNGLRIGALTTTRRIARIWKDLAAYPVLAEAVNEAASPQIRNLATIGGNMCQRPRCWYFRNGMGLLPDNQDGKSMVVAGDNRYAAILGNRRSGILRQPIDHCAGAHRLRREDPHLLGQGRQAAECASCRWRSFFVIPKSANEREHDLKPDEMVIELIVPPPSQNLKAATYEVRQRAAFDWPLAHGAVSRSRWTATR